MAAIKMETLPILTGKKAKDFILAAENPKKIVITDQQRKIYEEMNKNSK